MCSKYSVSHYANSIGPLLNIPLNQTSPPAGFPDTALFKDNTQQLLHVLLSSDILKAATRGTRYTDGRVRELCKHLEPISIQILTWN